MSARTAHQQGTTKARTAHQQGTTKARTAHQQGTTYTEEVEELKEGEEFFDFDEDMREHEEKQVHLGADGSCGWDVSRGESKELLSSGIEASSVVAASKMTYPR